MLFDHSVYDLFATAKFLHWTKICMGEVIFEICRIFWVHSNDFEWFCST